MNKLINNVFEKQNISRNTQNQIINIYNSIRKYIDISNPINRKPIYSTDSLKQIDKNKIIRSRYRQEVKILNVFGTVYVYDLNNNLLEKIENYSTATNATVSDSAEMQAVMLLLGTGLIAAGLGAGSGELIIVGIVLVLLAGLLKIIQDASRSSSSNSSRRRAIDVAIEESALTINTISEFTNNKIDEIVVDDKGKSGISNKIGHIVISKSVLGKYDIFNMLVTNIRQNRPECKNIPCNEVVRGIKIFKNHPCCLNPYSKYIKLPEIIPPIEEVNTNNQTCLTYCDNNNRVIECKDNQGNVIYRSFDIDERACCTIRCNPETNTWFKRCGNTNITNTDTYTDCSQNYKL